MDTRKKGSARVGKEEVLAMRQRYREGVTQRELCQVYGLSITTVGRIVRGETWTWLEGEDSAPIGAAVAGPLPEVGEENLAASAARLNALLTEPGEGGT